MGNLVLDAHSETILQEYRDDLSFFQEASANLRF